jgi:hypothetical protein
MNGELSGWNGKVMVYFKIIFSEKKKKKKDWAMIKAKKYDLNV